MATKKLSGTSDAVSTLKSLEAANERLLAQRERLRREIDRSSVRQGRLLQMLSQVPDVAEALRAGVCPSHIDADTWAALGAYVAKH
jgi:hypothetical protein